MKRLSCFAVLLMASTVAWADDVITLPTGEVTIGGETSARSVRASTPALN